MLADKFRSRFELWRERKGRRGSASGSASDDSEIWGDWTRPDRPTSVEVRVARQGGQSSAVDLMPCRLQWAKKQTINEPTERDILTRMAYEASYLRAENAYYRKVRRAAILFQAEVEAALLTYDSVQQLRSCLEQFQRFSANEKRNSLRWRSSMLGLLMPRSTMLRTAIDDCQVGIEQVDAHYRNLQKSERSFGSALRRIDQEYANSFSVQLDKETPCF